MKIESKTIDNHPFPGMDAALDRAYLRALELGRRTVTPVWVMVDGKLVDVLAEDREHQNGRSPTVNGTH